jgi:ribonuclease HI
MKQGILYTDGGSRGNPGPSASGAVLFGIDLHGNLTKELARKGEYIGETTNNIAEYKALVIGLELAIKQGIDALTCLLDSELIVKQLNGEYKIKNAGLQPLAAAIKALAKSFKNIEYKHVRRQQNKIADAIVNEVLDAH